MNPQDLISYSSMEGAITDAACAPLEVRGMDCSKAERPSPLRREACYSKSEDRSAFVIRRS